MINLSVSFEGVIRQILCQPKLEKIIKTLTDTYSTLKNRDFSIEVKDDSAEPIETHGDLDHFFQYLGSKQLICYIVAKEGQGEGQKDMDIQEEDSQKEEDEKEDLSVEEDEAMSGSNSSGTEEISNDESDCNTEEDPNPESDRSDRDSELDEDFDESFQITQNQTPIETECPSHSKDQLFDKTKVNRTEKTMEYVTSKEVKPSSPERTESTDEESKQLSSLYKCEVGVIRRAPKRSGSQQPPSNEYPALNQSESNPIQKETDHKNLFAIRNEDKSLADKVVYISRYQIAVKRIETPLIFDYSGSVENSSMNLSRSSKSSQSSLIEFSQQRNNNSSTNSSYFESAEQLMKTYTYLHSFTVSREESRTQSI